MKRLIIFLFALLFAVIIAAVLLPLAPVFDRGTAPPETSSQKEVKPEHAGVGIYIDASMSMRGFFGYSRTGGALIERFLWSWMQTEVLSVLPWSEISLSKFGNDLAAPEPLAEALGKSFMFSDKKSRDDYFQHTQTRLIEQLSAEMLRSYAAFIIITDGVPSSSEVSGPDPRFIASIRKNIIASEFHLWLIGAKSQFSGKIYPEVTGTKGKQSFVYEGARPIYLWIGSPEAHVGRAIVSGFERRLRLLAATEGGLGSEAVKVAEFSTHEIPECELKLDNTGMSEVLVRNREDYVEMIYSRHAAEVLRIPVTAHCTQTEISTRVTLSLKSRTPGVQLEGQNERWFLVFKPRHLKSVDLSLDARIDSEPWWIDWSTEDDSVSSNADRTLFMQQIVGGLISAPVDVTLASLRIEVN